MMLKNLKAKFDSLIQSFENFLFETEEVTNTYCIPCTWTISGNVYIEAPNADLAKSYARTKMINPNIEDCYCLKMNPDTEHPILCTCGNCGNEYIVSKFHINPRCPYCQDDKVNT